MKGKNKNRRKIERSKRCNHENVLKIKKKKRKIKAC